MSGIKLLAIALIVAGALALAYGGFTYTTRTHTADVGPVHVAVDEKKTVNIPLWAGVGAVVVGSIILLAPTLRGKS